MPKYNLETEKQKRVKEKIRALKKDYDFDEMKANDLEMLNQLAFLMVQLEDVELKLFSAIKEGKVSEHRELQKLASSIRADILKLQDGLGISRKSRKSSTESSVVEFIKDLKKRASELYDREMIYLFCPETNKLLGTMWIANKQGQHKVQLWCHDCNKHHFYNPASLAKKKKRNSSDNVPEGL